MYTINRQQLQVLTNRLTIKDSAGFLGVSPSTVSRWLHSKKVPATIKDYQSTINQFKKNYGNTKTNSNVTSKKKFVIKKDIVFKTDFKKQSTKEFRKDIVSDHDYYVAKKFDQKKIRKILAEIIQSNISIGLQQTKCLIKLKGDIKTADGNDCKSDYVSTDLFGVHFKKFILEESIDKLIENASALIYSEYRIQNIEKVFVVEVHSPNDPSIKPTKHELDGQAKIIKKPIKKKKPKSKKKK